MCSARMGFFKDSSRAAGLLRETGRFEVEVLSRVPGFQRPRRPRRAKYFGMQILLRAPAALPKRDQRQMGRRETGLRVSWCPESP